MKKLVLSLLVLGLLTAPCFASFLDNYYKIYPIEADTLFMQTLSALNTPNSGVEIFEIQSKNGYIVFSHNSKYYLLTLTKRYQNQTEIKILPQNSSFAPSDTTAQKVFSLIDLKVKTPMEMVK